MNTEFLRVFFFANNTQNNTLLLFCGLLGNNPRTARLFFARSARLPVQGMSVDTESVHTLGMAHALLPPRAAFLPRNKRVPQLVQSNRRYLVVGTVPLPVFPIGDLVRKNTKPLSLGCSRSWASNSSRAKSDSTKERTAFSFFPLWFRRGH